MAKKIINFRADDIVKKAIGIAAVKHDFGNVTNMIVSILMSDIRVLEELNNLKKSKYERKGNKHQKDE